jgi:hypothetical protein
MSTNRTSQLSSENSGKVALGAALVASLLLGCGGGSSPAGESCASLQSECFQDQKVCVEREDGGQCEACPSGHYATPEGSCQTVSGTAITHDFSTFTVKAGEEIKGLCQAWTLENDEDLWIQSVELSQDQLSHHSIWTYVPDDQFAGPDGVFNCKDRGYNELVGTVAGGVLYAQSTQAVHEVQHFPAGTAVRIPAHSKIISDVHLLNASSSDVTGHAKLTLYGVPASEVLVTLVPFEMAFRALKIPPHSTSRFSSECAIDASYTQATASPFDLKIHYILPHTHQQGKRLFMNVLGGPSDGKTIIDVHDLSTNEARGRFFDQPIDLTGASGIAFGCEYENRGDTTLSWSLEGEMCQLLGFADSKADFLSVVWDSTAKGSEGGMQLFTGACETTAIQWDFAKPGGN